jgi:hypothetical protein
MFRVILAIPANTTERYMTAGDIESGRVIWPVRDVGIITLDIDDPFAVTTNEVGMVMAIVVVVRRAIDTGDFQYLARFAQLIQIPIYGGSAYRRVFHGKVSDNLLGCCVYIELCNRV